MGARLDNFESQDKLQDIIITTATELQAYRRQMQGVNLDADTALMDVETVLRAAKPFILSYRKHSKTAMNLHLGGNVFHVHVDMQRVLCYRMQHQIQDCC